jgi:hypothetical protein
MSERTIDGPAENVSPESVARSIWERIRVCIENERHVIYEEIRNYPRPIPACDQQFNYLLDERARVNRELNQIDEACEDRLTSGNTMEWIEDLLNSSKFLKDEAIQEIRSYVREQLSKGAPVLQPFEQLQNTGAKAKN